MCIGRQRRLLPPAEGGCYGAHAPFNRFIRCYPLMRVVFRGCRCCEAQSMILNNDDDGAMIVSKSWS